MTTNARVYEQSGDRDRCGERFQHWQCGSDAYLGHLQDELAAAVVLDTADVARHHKRLRSRGLMVSRSSRRPPGWCHGLDGRHLDQDIDTETGAPDAAEGTQAANTRASGSRHRARTPASALTPARHRPTPPPRRRPGPPRHMVTAWSRATRNTTTDASDGDGRLSNCTRAWLVFVTSDARQPARAGQGRRPVAQGPHRRGHGPVDLRRQPRRRGRPRQTARRAAAARAAGRRHGRTGTLSSASCTAASRRRSTS